jgi:hypothetical protein
VSGQQACNDFIPSAMGGTWHVNLDMGREIAATGRVARIWEEDDSVLSLNSSPGRPTPSSPTTAALGLSRAHGENSKPGRIMWPKVNGGLTTGACLSPTAVHWVGSSLYCTLDLLLGAHVGLEESELGSLYWSMPSPTGSSPGQTTSLHIATSTATWTPSRPPTRQNHTGFCLAVLNCM